MTPRARTPITPYPSADTAAVRELLVMMKSTLGTLWDPVFDFSECQALTCLLRQRRDVRDLGRTVRAHHDSWAVNGMSQMACYSTCVSPQVMGQDSSHQISSLRRQIRHQDKKQDARVTEVKHMIKVYLMRHHVNCIQYTNPLKDVLKDHIANDMRSV
jgi:hypothetical protein